LKEKKSILNSIKEELVYLKKEELKDRYQKQLDLYAQALCNIFSTKECIIKDTENIIYSFYFNEAIGLNKKE
jgi:hypothetical protein